MTTEREKGEMDKLVSETYRELGVEKAPEHLNQNILRMAAANGKLGRSNGILSGAWMKPVAWAATIGLSLAIVLELTEVPTTAVPLDSEESIAEDFIAKDKPALERAEERMRQQNGAIQLESREDERVQGANTAIRENKLGRRPAASVPMSEPEPVVDQPVRRKVAADQVAAQERFSGLVMSSAVLDSELDGFCDPEARKSAGDWLACIEDLRASGATEEADLEYEAYILEYPAESGANK